ncbi:sulfur carrier protein ThiS [Crenobacter intestini]|uniref:Sulfur carrier protein ThiS n=1 Tax=Crenobacter intestini TaxID=2563443 RepID=A0A4T0V629_9NEIS|nr:sulfur carrier protein ThiS [Crenobacter intestini]TIC86897.1 sulfur carrier protein ThiS [Crenobacter intestini]
MIRIELDDVPLALAEGLTLDALLDMQGVARDAVATAVDGVFVPRSARAGFLLADGARVTLFQPIVGG